MKSKYILSLFLLAIVGCSTTADMVPVEGPLASVAPRPIIKAKVTGIEGNTGEISLKFPDSESCIGKWSSAAPVEVSVTNTSLITQYGTIYGSQVGVTNVPGVNRGQAYLNCDKGTFIEAEFYTGSGTANGYGFAKDNRGNIYKLVF